MTDQPQQPQKRNVPISDLDLQMQMIEPAYGKPGINPELLELLKEKGIVLNYETGNLEEAELSSLWSVLGIYTKDLRLGNIDKYSGEYDYVRVYMDLAADCLQAKMKKSFIICMSRVATVLELSQSKGGFLRKRQNTITSEQHYEGLEPAKKTIWNRGSNNSNMKQGGF